MTDTDDLVQRLRALTRCEHSDLSIGDEAADEIVLMRAEARKLCALRDEYKQSAIELRKTATAEYERATRAESELAGAEWELAKQMNADFNRIRNQRTTIEQLQAEVATIRNLQTVAESELAALRGRIDGGKATSTIVDRARELAYRAHAGQVDKAGRPYIEHVARVAAAVSDDPAAEAVGWVHDVMEDQPQYATLMMERLPASLYCAANLLDRNVAGGPLGYYERIRENPIALRVKLADIADNADESRLALLDEKTASRLRAKYADARRRLGVDEG